MRAHALAAILAAAILAFGARAQSVETTTYGYDPLGRLTQTGTSGTGAVNNGLSSTYGYDPAGNRSNVTVTPAPAPPAPSFAVNDVSVTEGGSLVFTVTKTGSTSSSFSLNFATADGTATAGSDYTAASGTLTFASTDVTKTITVATTDDAAVESAETVLVNLSGATGGSTISDAQGIGTINDNDAPPPPSFAINDVSVTEGGSLILTVTKTGSTSSSFSVNFATANGTATAGSDYTAASGTLTFASTDVTKTITVATTDDAAVESAETVLVNLSGATGGATITDAQGVGTINDNDVPPPPSFAINDVSVTEGGSLVFTVTKTGSTSSSFSVNFATANGTATAGSDYTAASGTLTFASTDVTKTVTVGTTDDATVESAETVLVNLSAATGGATISDSQGVGTINDNDVAGTCSSVGFSVNDTSATEGDPFAFTITKTGSSTGSCSVNYATANGTAITPNDYAARSGTLTFASNETTKPVSTTTPTSGPNEGTEYFYLNLSGATGGATITDSQGVGTIYNYNDVCLTCRSAPASGDPPPPPDPG